MSTYEKEQSSASPGALEQGQKENPHARGIGTEAKGSCESEKIAVEEIFRVVVGYPDWQASNLGNQEPPHLEIHKPMTSLQINVHGLPKGQPRAKASRRGAFVRMYNPDTADDWKGCIARAVAAFVPKGTLFPLFAGPVRVDTTFIFPRPKGHFRKNGDIKPNAPTWHTAKPDRDNCDKAVLDVFTQCQVFADDAQVCDGRIMKRYAGVGEATGARIHILSLSDEG